MSHDDVRETLAGTRRWGAVCSDAVEWLKGLPDDSVDLLFTSPPYEHARTYGIGCDVRESQVELTRRRMSTVTGPLFPT